MFFLFVLRPVRRSKTRYVRVVFCSAARAAQINTNLTSSTRCARRVACCGPCGAGEQIVCVLARALAGLHPIRMNFGSTNLLPPRSALWLEVFRSCRSRKCYICLLFVLRPVRRSRTNISPHALAAEGTMQDVERICGMVLCVESRGN